MAAGFTFAVLATLVGASGFLGVFPVPGFAITIAVFVALHTHPSAHPLVLWCMSTAFNTLIYSGLLGLFLWLFRAIAIWSQSKKISN